MEPLAALLVASGTRILRDLLGSTEPTTSGFVGPETGKTRTRPGTHLAAASARPPS
jgi:hypothetical protein